MATEQTWEVENVAEDAFEPCFLLNAPSLIHPGAASQKESTQAGRGGLLSHAAPPGPPAAPLPSLLADPLLQLPVFPETQAIFPSKAPSSFSLAALCTCCCICRITEPLPAFRGDSSSFGVGSTSPRSSTCYHTGPVKATGGPPYQLSSGTENDNGLHPTTQVPRKGLESHSEVTGRETHNIRKILFRF